MHSEMSVHTQLDTWSLPFESLKVLWHEKIFKIDSDIKASQNYMGKIAILPILEPILLAS